MEIRGREHFRGFPHSEEHPEPPTGQNVYPYQICHCFAQRRGAAFSPVPDCFWCHYAYFGLENERALEVGICRYPEVQVV